MRAFVALVMVAGCGFQPRAASTTSDGTAPGDTALGDGSSGSGSAAIDAGPDAPTDTDNDGIPDSLDNCPTMSNPDQRDHDVDGRGDVCDLCPHISEPSDVDNDGDGVGDACDPRPNTAGDTRALWVGFYDANDITGWTMAGTWTVSAGKLSGGATNQSLLYAYPPVQFQHAFAQTSVHINTLAMATGSVSPAALFYTGDAGISQYYLCEPALTNNGKILVANDNYPVNTNHFDQMAWSGTFAAGSDLLLTDYVMAAKHTCKASQGATTATVVQDSGSSTGVVTLGAANATVSYDYLFVVEIGQ